MGFAVFSFFLWPVVLFKFGVQNLGRRSFRSALALLFSLIGFAGYAIIPYRLLIISHYYPLPTWSYLVVPAAYVLGYFLYWKIDDSPLVKLM